MKNKEITMMELLQRLYNNNAPKNIKYKGRKYKLNTQSNIYKANVYEEEKTGNLLGYNYKLELCLNDTVEILSEENSEWEDIEEIKHNGKQIYNTKTNAYNTLNSKEKNIFIPIINQLIKNQRKIVEKLDKNEIMFDYYVEKLEAKEKLENKDE